MINNLISGAKLESLFSTEELWLVNVLFRDKPIELKSFSDEESAYLCSFVIRNGLSSLLYRSNYVNCLPARFKLELRKEYLFNLGRNTAFQLVADEMVNTLHNYGVNAILLKGSFLAPFIYSDVAFRPMGDIDILVPAEKALSAWQLLNPEGASKTIDDDETGHHLPSFILRGCLIEIHRYLFPYNAKFALPINEIWAQSEPIEGKKSRTIHPVHQIIYLSIHIYYNYRRGGLRLGWFYDIKVLLDYYGDRISLKEVEELAQKWKVMEPVKIVLTFFSVLLPGNKLFIPSPKTLERSLEEMILMFQYSDKQKLEYSYGIAWERLWHTKGFINKIRFLWNILIIQKNGRKTLSLYRLWHLVKNTFRFLKRKMLW